MSELSRKSLGSFVRFQGMLALLLFLPAWTLRYWEAWLYWSVQTVVLLAITLYFLKYDPRLIERRLVVGPGAEKEKCQVRIQTVASVLTLLLYVVPGFDYRLRWSTVPFPVVLAADGVVVLAFLLIFIVFRENSYASGIVTVEADQRVISTGPYRLVRHPMYTAGMLMFLATPPALGSYYGLVVAVLLCVAVVVRLLDEERFLSASLPGYDAYRQKVRYRLVPLVW